MINEEDRRKKKAHSEWAEWQCPEGIRSGSKKKKKKPEHGSGRRKEEEETWLPKKEEAGTSAEEEGTAQLSRPGGGKATVTCWWSRMATPAPARKC